jgi:heat shock protein HslJ
MTRLTLATCLALASCITPVLSAEPIIGIDWQLLAIDGQVTDTTATLRMDDAGNVSGRAPCNRWFATTAAPLPAFQLTGIGATRMACDDLAKEDAFFDALSDMQSAALDGDRNLILTAPDGRSMEFVQDRTYSLTVCKTCNP